MEEPLEPPVDSKPIEEEFSFDPQHDYHDGIAFTFTGSLMVPITGETERREKEDAEAKVKRTSVKMNFKDFVKMRA